MPDRKAAAAKRKSLSSAHSPARSSKKRTIQPETSSSSSRLDGAPSSSLVQRWAAGVAAQLVPSTAQLEQHASGGGEVEIDVDGAGRAAVDALPAGKLRAELLRDEEATGEALWRQVEALRAKQQEQQQEQQEQEKQKQKQKIPQANQSKKNKVAGPGAEGDSVAAAAGVVPVVPCTARLYRQARVAAGGDTKLLKALAVNPRAPLDLLVNAVGAGVDGGSSGGGALESPVVGLRALAAALAADPRAAVSPSGVAFYADRAAAFASSAATAATKGGAASTAEAAAGAAEACGLMLRILQVAGLAVNNTAPAGGTAGEEETDGGRGGGGGGDGDGDAQGESATIDPADRLLLPCSPQTSSPPSDVVVATAAAAAAAVAGAPAATKVPPPPARLSVSRLLAHYAVISAACSTRRDKEAGSAAAAAAAAAVIRSVRATATGRDGGGGGGAESESSSSDDEATNDAHGGGGNSSILSQHLSSLCAANLAGNEPATLEFLRCVGDAVCAVVVAAPKATATNHVVAAVGGDDAVRASLALTCSRALARLPRPSASPAPTAAQFLKRAYAFRVVDALNRSAAAAAASSSSSFLSAKKGAVTAVAVAGRESSATARSGGGGGGGGSTGGTGASASPWDFVGAAAVSPALLEFLGRPEAAAAAAGEGPAVAAAVERLASRRHSPAALVELLRSSPACAPSALGALLSALERLEGGVGHGEDGGDGGDRVGGKAAPAMGGFFLDTGGAVGARAGAGAGAGTVLARLGSGGDLLDMDEVDVASAVSSVLSDSDNEA